MPRKFKKTIDCGCVILTISVGIKNITLQDEENKKMYCIGGHKHFLICDECNEKENSGEDTLYEMFEKDCYTDDFGYNGWKEVIIVKNSKNCIEIKTL